MITQLELIIAEIETGLASLLALEAPAARLAFKERRQGFAQPHERLPGSILGHFPGPGKLLPPDRIELLLERERRRSLACFKLPIPCRQCPVPDKSCRSSGFGKIHLLLCCGVKAYLV